VKGFGCRPVVTYPRAEGPASETLHQSCRSKAAGQRLRRAGKLSFVPRSLVGLGVSAGTFATDEVV
jgi:hypothetical protein